MHPFNVATVLDELTDTYPPAEVLLSAIRAGDWDCLRAISRLWLSEGIPFAFRSRPSIYEAIRVYLSDGLNVQAKEITVIGSGRQGYCLSADANVGRPFGQESDLDVTAISSSLFERLREAFERWKHDYERGDIQPRSAREKEYWDRNRDQCPSGLRRGFIDPHKIPTFRCYPEAQRVANALWRTHEKLKVTPNAPHVRKVSLRTYKDWDSFVGQMVINLKAVGRIRRVTG